MRWKNKLKIKEKATSLIKYGELSRVKERSDVGDLFFLLFLYLDGFLFFFGLYSIDKIPEFVLLFFYSSDLLSNACPHSVILFLTSFKAFNIKKGTQWFCVYFK